jgi:hypothetical protein
MAAPGCAVHRIGAAVIVMPARSGSRDPDQRRSHGRLDVNGVVREALTTAGMELQAHRVSVAMDPQ